MGISNFIFTKPRFNEKPSAWVEHIPFAFFLIEKIKPRVFVELGTHFGNSYFAFCQAISEIKINCKAYAVDQWTGDEQAGNYGDEVFEYVDRIHSNHFAEFSVLLKMTFDEALANFSDQSIDLLHIDGLHSYESVKHDFENWLPKMSDQGVIVLHDTNVHEKGFGVWKLMEEIRGKYLSLEFIHGHGLGIICVGKNIDPEMLEFVGNGKNDFFTLQLFAVLGRNISITSQLDSKKEELDLLSHQLEEQRNLFNQHQEQFINDIKNLQNTEVNHLIQLDKYEKENHLLNESNYKNQIEIQNKLLTINSLEDELIKTKNQLANRESANLQITNSISWKYTKPFRTVSEAYPGYKRFIHKLLKKNNLGSKKIIESYSQGNLPTLKTDILFGEGVLQKKLQEAHSKIPFHTITVDIIICIHNAHEDVKKCLSSIIEYTNPPYQIILVDDGSQTETQTYLEQFSISQGCKLIRNEKASGYTKAANQGLKASSANMSLLLNSDTIIGNNEWLDRMIYCALSEPEIGIVSVLSNTASWQSVPQIFNGDDWADNSLPNNFSIAQMAKMIMLDSISIYPKLSFLNGFCLLIKKDCLHEVGYFDEVSFPEGYGEENDFCMRSASKNWKLAVADDVYIYHSQSKSYSNERRQRISKLSDVALVKKHSADLVSKGVFSCKENIVLHGIRSRVAHFVRLAQIREECLTKYSTKKILFVLPVTALGGGGNVVIQEIRALRSMNVDCYIANKSEYKFAFESAYEIADIPVVYFDSAHSLGMQFDYFDAVIGTAWISIEWIREAIQITKSNITSAYYIQDYEPYFYPEGSKNRKEALSSYSLIQGMKLFTKTDWNRNKVLVNTGLESTIIHPSLNMDIFRPLLDKSFTNKIYITAMVRPETPRRAPELTLQTLKEIKGQFKNDVEIITFGCDTQESLILKYKAEFDFNHFGVLTPEQLSILFNKSHIFIDMSEFQAMGLTGMEAMACGNSVILPIQGGSDSFIRNELNGYLIDTSSSTACVSLVNLLLKNRITLSDVAFRAISDICQFSPIYSSKNILSCLFDTTQ
ncbi:MAG: class I SAM-dependent methyltransferase [Bacteroidales bacterium]